MAESWTWPLQAKSDRFGKQTIMPPDAADDHLLAARLAAEAGELLVGLRARLSADGLDGKPLGAEGDRAAHELLMNRLASARPGDAVLSEEGVADPARLDAERVWIVDPLDGTREFGELPRTDWAVHVALVVAGSPVAGAVALPARDLTLATSPPPSAPAPWPGSPRVLVSRSRPPVSAGRVAGVGGRQSHGGRARRGRGLPAQRRPTRVGLGRPGGGRPRRGAARLEARRLAPRLPPAGPLHARPAHLPTRAGRPRDRRRPGGLSPRRPDLRQ